MNKYKQSQFHIILSLFCVVIVLLELFYCFFQGLCPNLHLSNLPPWHDLLLTFASAYVLFTLWITRKIKNVKK
jgi:hypothetical protein